MTADLPDLARYTGDRRQFASVRRIILDEGAERGVAALAFSTGGGLDFWVLVDRAMDIGPLQLDGRPVAWQSPAGFRHPAFVDPDSEGGYGFSRGFSGFLMTCGLDQTRHPSEGRPHHGRLPFLPARLTACGEAFEHGTPHLFCEGEIAQWKHGGEHLTLLRRIETPIGGRSLTIRDRVVNRGSEPQRHALLYHVNIGHPFLCPGARITGEPSPLPAPITEPRLDAPSSAACLPVRPNAGGHGLLALERPDGTALRLAFSAATLPYAQAWTDLRPGIYVASLEPCTDDFGDGGRGIDPVILAPGEVRDYELTASFTKPD